jgi:hypothetical protein
MREQIEEIMSLFFGVIVPQLARGTRKLSKTPSIVSWPHLESSVSTKKKRHFASERVATAMAIAKMTLHTVGTIA